MVADDSAARAVWLGDNGALAVARPGTVCLESSTITPEWVCELDAAVTARQGELLDAPVTGSSVQAAAGELNFLVGGSAATLDQVRPVLAAMSTSITLLDPVSSGALVKLINNFVCAVQVTALAEGIAMIERSGLDRASAPGSPLVKGLSARMTAADYTPHFHLRLMARDLSYAIKEAGTHALDFTIATTALAAFERAVAAGHGDKDLSAVIESLRDHPAGCHARSLMRGQRWTDQPAAKTVSSLPVLSPIFSVRTSMCSSMER